MAQRFDKLYKVKQGDDLGDPIFWNPRFQDIDLRIAALEGAYTKIDDAAQQVISLGIGRINDTFQPLLNGLTTNVNTLNSTVTTLEAQIVTSNTSVTNQLNAIIAQANTTLAQLQAMGTFDGGTF